MPVTLSACLSGWQGVEELSLFSGNAREYERASTPLSLTNVAG